MNNVDVIARIILRPGTKVRRPDWDKEQYIFQQGDVWYDESDNQVFIEDTPGHGGMDPYCWELWQEPDEVNVDHYFLGDREVITKDEPLQEWDYPENL